MCEARLERSFAKHFAPLEDPRDAVRRRHKLIDMIVIAIAAVRCGRLGGDRRVWPRQAELA
jgi:hypothetical protein